MSELTFEWDEAKAKQNLLKHGVSFEEAKEVLNDPFAISIEDPDHSEDENRWVDIGISASGRMLVVWYTEREAMIRIIGSRIASPGEHRSYENERTQ